MNRKVLIVVGAATLLAAGTGLFFALTAKTRAYNALKADIQQSVKALKDHVSDSTGQALNDKIKAGTSELTAIEKQYADAVTSNADAAAKKAIAQKYVDTVKSTNEAVAGLIAHIAKLQSPLPDQFAALDKYTEQANADVDALKQILAPLDAMMTPVAEFSKATAPVGGEMRRAVMARVNAGENLTEELQNEELIKAVETVLTKKASAAGKK